MNDLACANSDGVNLGDLATLNLNGFSITGPGGGSGVLCGFTTETTRRVQRCTVNGPGAISNFSGGVFAGAHVRLVTVNHLTVNGNESGIYATYSQVKANDIVANGNTEWGILADRLRGTNIQTNNNGEGGVGANKFSLLGLTATGNGSQGGVIYGSGPIVGSTVTGNDGLGQGYDIISQKRVRLLNTVCGKSAKLDALIPPNVIGSFGCAND